MLSAFAGKGQKRIYDNITDIAMKEYGRRVSRNFQENTGTLIVFRFHFSHERQF